LFTVSSLKGEVTLPWKGKRKRSKIEKGRLEQGEKEEGGRERKEGGGSFPFKIIFHKEVRTTRYWNLSAPEDWGKGGGP